MALFGALLGGVLGLAGSRSAAKTQASATDRATELQREIYEDTSGKLEGFRTAGDTALNRLLPILGLAAPGADFQPLELSPAAQFAMTQGRDTIEAGAAARGGLFSGSTAKGLEEFRTGLATQDRDSQLNRLFSLTQMGANAAAGQGAQGTQFAQSAGNNIIAGGNARAAGIVGGVNAVNDAIGNYYGYQNFNRLMDLAR